VSNIFQAEEIFFCFFAACLKASRGKQKLLHRNSIATTNNKFVENKLKQQR